MPHRQHHQRQRGVLHRLPRPPLLQPGHRAARPVLLRHGPARVRRGRLADDGDPCQIHARVLHGHHLCRAERRAAGVRWRVGRGYYGGVDLVHDRDALCPNEYVRGRDDHGGLV